jgi:hypothetical protein
MYHEKLMIKKVAKRRLLAKVAFLVRDLDGYTKLFYRSQKGLSHHGYKDFKREKSRRRRSREKMALRAWLAGDEGRFEKYLAEEKKSLMWWLW